MSTIPFDYLNHLLTSFFSRVNELEQKIEQLNNELLQHRSQMSSNSPQGSIHSNNQSPVHPGGQSFPNHFSPLSSYQQNTIGQRSSLSGTPISAERGNNSRGTKRPVNGGSSFEFINENDHFPKNGATDAKRAKVSKLTKAQQIEQLIGSTALSDVSNMVTQVAEERLRRVYSSHVDLIDSGILTIEEAQQRLKMYFEVIFAKYPFVDVPTDVETFKSVYPVLFNVVMAVTCVASTNDADFDKNLNIENIATQEVIHEVVVIGNKSIELLKSLLLLTIWYNMPELFHNRRYHIFSALCITMTQDLGLTGRPYYVVNKSEGSVLRSEVLEDPQKDEYRCLVLAVYSASIGYSLFLRRKLFVTWTPYLEDSYQHLRTSSKLKFRSVAIFAKLTSLLEKIHSFVELKDQENLSFIQHFQRAIDFLKDQQTTMDSNVLLGFAYSVEAFLYSKFTSEELSFKCLHSTLQCLHHFSSLTPAQFCSVPLLIYGRLMYCFALLLKTSNCLSFEFDFSSIKRIMNTLDECNKIYKTNHLLVKTKLLFYFYLTTYSKNENAFNELANISSSETVVNANSQNSSISGTPTNTSSANQPPKTSLHQPVVQQSFEQQHQQHAPAGDAPGMATSHIPQGYPQQPHHPINTGNIPPHSHQYPDQYQHPLMHPQQHSHQQVNGPPMNVYPGISMPNTNSMLPQHDQLESHMEPVYPQLDVLSDATMKGFGDIPTELMGQDEFWKLFDYKDEQFLL